MGLSRGGGVQRECPLLAERVGPVPDTNSQEELLKFYQETKLGEKRALSPPAYFTRQTQFPAIINPSQGLLNKDYKSVLCLCKLVPEVNFGPALSPLSVPVQQRQRPGQKSTFKKGFEMNKESDSALLLSK